MNPVWTGFMAGFLVGCVAAIWLNFLYIIAKKKWRREGGI